MVDVEIVGGGPAGLAAALYAARAGLSVRVLDAAGGGGQPAMAAEVEDYPGVGRTFGAGLAARFLQDAVAAGAVLLHARVSEITRQGGGFVAVAGKRYYPARSLILANGRAPRTLGVPGEAALLDKGVSYYAAKGDRFFGGCRVAVVGKGERALQDALYLARTAAAVHLIYEEPRFWGGDLPLRELMRLPNVVWHPQRRVVEICGEGRVKGLLFEAIQGGEAEFLAVDEVFISLGSVPANRGLSPLLPLDDEGYIIAGEDCTTEAAGLFVAGDTRKKQLCRIATAVADGINAAEGARRYLTGFSEKGDRILR